jgi:hypothetical protein
MALGSLPKPLLFVALDTFAGGRSGMASCTSQTGRRYALHPYIVLVAPQRPWHMPWWHSGGGGGGGDVRADTSIRPYGGEQQTPWRIEV